MKNPTYVCFCCCVKIFVTFKDINECYERSDDCDHLCTNTIGSYNCSCRDGYYLHQDGKTCLGKQIHIQKPVKYVRLRELRK